MIMSRTISSSTPRGTPYPPKQAHIGGGGWDDVGISSPRSGTPAVDPLAAAAAGGAEEGGGTDAGGEDSTHAGDALRSSMVNATPQARPTTAPTVPSSHQDSSIAKSIRLAKQFADDAEDGPSSPKGGGGGGGTGQHLSSTQRRGSGERAGGGGSQSARSSRFGGGSKEREPGSPQNAREKAEARAGAILESSGRGISPSRDKEAWNTLSEPQKLSKYDQGGDVLSTVQRYIASQSNVSQQVIETRSQVEMDDRVRLNIAEGRGCQNLLTLRLKETLEAQDAARLNAYRFRAKASQHLDIEHPMMTAQRALNLLTAESLKMKGEYDTRLSEYVDEMAHKQEEARNAQDRLAARQRIRAAFDTASVAVRLAKLAKGSKGDGGGGGRRGSVRNPGGRRASTKPPVGKMGSMRFSREAGVGMHGRAE